MPSNDAAGRSSARRAAWLEAAKVLAADPAARVRCPNCQDDFLTIEDIAVESPGGRYVERILRCPACGTWESILREVPKGR